MPWPMRKRLLAATALMQLCIGSAAAGPNGATVVGGAATVQGQGTATVTVTQQSNSAIINWNTFNIGAGETTRIIQPSSSSVELDRVTGGAGPSAIFGSLFSNGQIFVVNAGGILFGPSAKIDTAGFLATTSNISNRDFMAGHYNFAIPGNPAASIVNQGTITAQTGGFAALVAPGVRNTGTITATLGTIGLASANTFALDFYGDRLIQLNVNDAVASTVIDVSTGQPLSALVSNAGKLKANGGQVELTAVAARSVVDSVINNSGVIEANSVGTRNGVILLEAATAAGTPAAAPTQTVTVSGTLSAAGKRKDTTGGTVVVTGENVQISGARINASGRAGGGKVAISGTSVTANGTIAANGATGGSVSLASSGNLWVSGAVAVTGLSGTGGFVDLAGTDIKLAGATIDASGASGGGLVRIGGTFQGGNGDPGSALYEILHRPLRRPARYRLGADGEHRRQQHDQCRGDEFRQCRHRHRLVAAPNRFCRQHHRHRRAAWRQWRLRRSVEPQPARFHRHGQSSGLRRADRHVAARPAKSDHYDERFIGRFAIGQ